MKCKFISWGKLTDKLISITGMFGKGSLVSDKNVSENPGQGTFKRFAYCSNNNGMVLKYLRKYAWLLHQLLQKLVLTIVNKMAGWSIPKLPMG